MHANAKTRFLALLLAAIMLIGVLPLSIFAEETLSVSTYDDFLTQLEVLEGYAKEYASTAGKSANVLIVNFIRTGVERYNGGNWTTLAGEEITGFTDYVKNQDTAKGTTAMALRDIKIDNFKLPNGDAVDFGHMFGTLNIALINAQQTGDLGGWAGDICDLMMYSSKYGYVPDGTIDEKADFIRTKCFGVDADDAFGMDDFYGDMDAFYINKRAKAGDSFTTIFKEYFTSTLSDSDRAAFFLNNRFKGLKTRDEVRNAIYTQYSTNVGLSVLEADRGLSNESDLRYACCYAFADYLFNLAGDRLTGEGGDDDTSSDFTFKVFSTANSTLAPGITQSINYANSSNGQFMYYLSSIDVSRDDVFVSANYKDNDPSKGWGMQTLTSQMKAAQKNHSNPGTSNYIENYTPIVGINADFYNMSSGQPSGSLIVNGVKYQEGSGNFFGIKKDGTPIIGGAAEWKAYKDELTDAVGGSILLIKDGEKVAASGSYYTTPGTRSAVGITADGKVVFLVVDGRQAPMSVGATVDETAQILLDAGCVIALHLDGGGSATYVSKPEGSDSLKLVNSPSDGYERSVSSTLIAVSTAKSSTEFDHANITSDYDYLTIGTSLQLTATGVSNTGNAASIPSDAKWTLSDNSIGSISADGVFTATANGTVEVRLTVGSETVGSKTLNVVVPDALAFTKENFAVIYDVPFEVPIQATYKSNKVKINPDDITIGWEYEDNGIIDDFTLTVNATNGIRSMMIAALLNNEEFDDDDNPIYIMCTTTINMYKADEAYFDFDNVTAGNRTLAWIRKILNATEESDNYYHVDDPNKKMTTEYTFGLDMSALEVPTQLADLTSMLPGAEDGATAWDFLCNLAERVSVLTEVKISMTIDQNFDVDYSDLKLSTDFFTLKAASLDEKTNVLTITFGWIDRTMAVDPATTDPICILSGLKLTPKTGAFWNSSNVLAVKNVGDVSYKIYLRANALYNFAIVEKNQQQYGLYPFVNPDVEVEGNPERGASFGSTYVDFEDSYSLDKTDRNGWIENDSVLTYWKDNRKLTGLQYLPSYENSAVKKFYQLDENGAVTGVVNGFLTYGGNLYYAIDGAPVTGWRPIMEDSGEKTYYYFDSTGKAVNGSRTICGYSYVFDNYKLVRGDLRKVSGDTLYMWAGDWVSQQWMTIDGDRYYFRSSLAAATGLYSFAINGANVYYLFDENGKWLSDYTGIYDNGTYSFYIKNGIKVNYPGLVKIGDYYYYFKYSEGNALGVMVKNCTHYIDKHNDLMRRAQYNFDAEGRMTNPGTILSTPTYVTGIVEEEDGSLQYYRDGSPYYAGLIKVGDDYYYVQPPTGKPSATLVTDRTYRITKTNGLLPVGEYKFGADGKIDLSDPDLDFWFAGYTLTLDGKIGLNFYTFLPTWFVNDTNAYIEFKIGDLTYTLYVKDAVRNGIYHVFTVPVDAYMMSDKIEANAYSGGKLVGSDSESVRDYAMYMINNPSGYTAGDIAFAKALLNYGAASQVQFGKNTNDLANKLLEENDKQVPTLSASALKDYAATKASDDSIGTFTGMNLALGDAIRLNVYFEAADGVDMSKIAFEVNGKPAKYKNGRITYENIMAWQLDDKLVITAEYEGMTLTYTCYALTYCYNVLTQRENGNTAFSDDLVSLLSALYVYQQKSEIYSPKSDS